MNSFSFATDSSRICAGVFVLIGYAYVRGLAVEGPVILKDGIRKHTHPGEEGPRSEADQERGKRKFGFHGQRLSVAGFAPALPSPYNGLPVIGWLQRAIGPQLHRLPRVATPTRA